MGEIADRFRDWYRQMPFDDGDLDQILDWWAKNAAEKQERIAELEAEIERLKGWKADALRVIESWDAVFDMVPGKSEHLGRSMSDVVAARIAELEQRGVTNER